MNLQISQTKNVSATVIRELPKAKKKIIMVVVVCACIHTHMYTHTHNYMYLLNKERIRIFLHTLLERLDHQYLNGQHFASEVWTGMYEILTKNERSFIYKRFELKF